MRKFLFFFSFLFAVMFVNGQFSSDLVVYSPYGDAFSLFLNNSKVNNYPSSKISVNDLQFGNYNVKIVFQNRNIPKIQQSIYIEKNAQVACALLEDNNGNFFIDIFNSIIYTDINDYNPPIPVPVPNPVNPSEVYCDYPMEAANFMGALASIKNQSFDSDKLIIAKQITNANCLSTNQIKQIVAIFDFESEKIKYAKYAYTHCFDPQNYYIVNDAFTFSSSIKKLNDYISTVH